MQILVNMYFKMLRLVMVKSMIKDNYYYDIIIIMIVWLLFITRSEKIFKFLNF